MADTLSPSDLARGKSNFDFLDDLITESVADTILSPEGETWTPLPKWFSALDAGANAAVDSVVGALSATGTTLAQSMQDKVDSLGNVGSVNAAIITSVRDSIRNQGSVAGINIASSRAQVTSARDLATLDMASMEDAVSAFSEALQDTMQGKADAFSEAIDSLSFRAQETVLDFINTIELAQASYLEVMAEDYEDWSRDIQADSQDIVNSVHTEIYDKIGEAQAAIDALNAAALANSNAASPFLFYTGTADLSADLDPVADKIAIVQEDAALYRKIGASGTGSWQQFTGSGSLASKARSTDFGVIHDAYSAKTNQYAKLVLMTDAALAAGHGIVQIDRPETPGEAVLCNGTYPDFAKVKWDVHPEAAFHGTNDIPWVCERCDGPYIWLPDFTRWSIDGGGETRDEYMHQPDAVFAWDGLLYVAYHYNPTSNQEQDAGQIIKMQRRLDDTDQTWEDLGSPWYDGATATNPWNPLTEDDRMLQTKFMWWGDELWNTQVSGRGSPGHGLMVSKQFEKDGDWTNYFFWFSNADGSPILTTDLSAPSGHSHTITIAGVEYHPYAPGGRLVTRDGRGIIYVTLVPASGGNLQDRNKIHIPLYTEDRVTWQWGPTVPLGDLEPQQAWEMRVAQLGPNRYLGAGRLPEETGTVTENAGRFHALNYSSDGVNWTPWAIIQSELPLETVVPIPLNGNHLIYPGSNSKVRRTAQSLNIMRHPFTAVIGGPRMSAEERRDENYYRHNPASPSDTLILPDFDVTGVAGRLRGRNPNGTWQTFTEGVDYSVVQATDQDTIDFGAGLATQWQWIEYRELIGELAMVSAGAVNYATGEIVCIWSQNRQADQQVGGTEILVASTFDLPRPNMANVIPTDAAEFEWGDGNSYVVDLPNNQVTLFGAAWANVDYPREQPIHMAVPWYSESLPAADSPDVLAVFGDVEEHWSVDVDNDAGRRYMRVRRGSKSGSASGGQRTVPEVNRRILDPAHVDPIVFRVDHKINWAQLGDGPFFETTSRSTFKLGDGQFISLEPPAGRPIVFDLAKASFLVGPWSFTEPLKKPDRTTGPNLFRDPFGRDPRYLRERRLLRPGQFFWPGWRCITTGGAEVYATEILTSIDVANDDAGGDRRILRFDMETAGSGDLIVEAVWESPDSMFGQVHTLKLEARNFLLDADATAWSEILVDFYIYPHGNLYAGAAASLMGRAFGREWRRMRGAIPVPLWDESNIKPLSLTEAAVGLRFVTSTTVRKIVDMRWLDFFPGIGDRPFTRRNAVDQQHRLDRDVQVIQPQQRFGALFQGNINDNGDGTFSLRAGRSLRSRMRRGPDATWSRAFAARGRSGANVILETFEPTLLESDEGYVVAGSDTLTGGSWNDGMFAEIIGLTALRETIVGNGSARDFPLAQIMTENPADVTGYKVTAGSGTETIAEGTDFIYYPPRERKHIGAFTADGTLNSIEATFDLSQSGVNVAIWNESAASESILSAGEYVVTQGESGGDPDTLTFNATPAEGMIDLWEGSSADTFAQANFPEPFSAATTYIIEDSARNDSAVELAAHPTFYGQLAAATSAFIAQMATAPIMQLSEALDRIIGRAAEWGLWDDRLDTFQIFGLHNEADSLLDAIGASTPTFEGTYIWQRHKGVLFTNSNDGYVDTGFQPDGSTDGTNYQEDAASLMVFTQRVEAAASGYLIGSDVARFAPDLGSGAHAVRFNDATGDSGAPLTNDLASPGFWALSRDNGSNYVLAHQGGRGRFRTRTVAGTSSGLPGGNVLLNRYDTSYGQHQILGFAAGSNYSAAELRQWSILWHELARHLTQVPLYDS